ncbi:glyoxylate reductase/hydroxypyruvate reductase [Anabrus simplex]|uniref:glyoxylate reductase/hydroxypyruvate reductase n=1 Tax=Anabrus simplex TaxID=316456 RepID=UPI0035A34A13
MTKPKVLITNGEIMNKVLDNLREKCELIICPELPYPSRKDILNRIKGVDAVFWCTKERLDTEMLDTAGPNLKIVSTMSAGYDHIDIAAVKSRGIKIGNTSNVLNASVAEIAVALALMAGRRLQEGRQVMERGAWEPGSPIWMLGHDLYGSTVGIVGLGNIGCEIAKRLKAFEISRLLYSGHSVKPAAAELGAQFVSFDDLLKESDFIIIACPLNDGTRNMFNDTAFSKMKKNAIIVNIGRGGVIDQPALIRALESGKIYAAGLDVMVPEPLPTDHPLLKLKNCVLIPHLGSATVRTRLAMADLAARNILAALDGKEMPSPL